MTQHAERAGLGFHTCLKGVAVDHSARNEVENLLEDDNIAAGWWCFFHKHPTEWQGFKLNTSPLFHLKLSRSVGRLCIHY
jgi:hypothetical protein